ncbi:hypothetical protein D3C72_2369650 [compost metagenome]
MQAYGQAAQDTGQAGVVGFEGFDRQVDAIDQVVVRNGGFQFKLGLDLPHQLMQVFALFF